MEQHDEIYEILTSGGLVFRRGGGDKKAPEEGRVKTKAKKKKYITGAHGSGSALQKSKYRAKRANRNKNK